MRHSRGFDRFLRVLGGGIAAFSLFLPSASLLGWSDATAAETGTSATKAYTFGVFPYLPPRELEKVFAPIAADLSKVLGREVQFTSSTTYETFANNVARQMFDIAFIQPFDYVDAADKYGYLPIATRSEVLKALIVTTKDSPVKTVADLRGKRISLPPEDAAVSHLTRVYLRKSGLAPDKDVTLNYFRSHMSCLQQVLIDAADACGTAAPALRYFKSRMGVEMRVIAEGEPIPHTLFVAHSRVPAQDRSRIHDRILGWSKSPEGKEILDRGKMTGFVTVTNEAYDVVRKFPRD